ncbi:MAG: hypothetical protein IJ467_02980 [Bacteroidaceae bacterium]|nr:hypothetical protein [Bacteroidaceae bacterium]
MKQTVCICISLLLCCEIFSQNEQIIFPNGMEWKEVVVELGMPIDTTYYNLYTVDKDTIINNTAYKKILLNGKYADISIREHAGIVWVHTKEYPHEFKLYDFNWEKTSSIRIEYLREKEEGIEMQETELDTNYETVYVAGKEYQYLSNNDFVMIRNIGRVSELNRNSCILGYKVPEVILPGLTYWKVLWIKRDGNIIFSSDKSEEWIGEIPNIIKNTQYPNLHINSFASTLHFTSPTATRVELYTLDAVKVGEATFAGGEAVLEAPHAPAAYLYIVTYPDGHRESGKVMVED